MRKVQLITTVLGAAVLAIGVAQAGPMGGGPGGGMGMAPVPAPPSGPMGVNGFNNQNVNTDTCGDNAATRIPCTHHDTKAKAKTKGAASAEGANAAANVPGAGMNGSAGATTNTATGAPPH